MQVFKRICPNCGGEITDERLKLGFVCEKCSENSFEIIGFSDVKRLRNLLLDEKKLLNYEKYYRFLKEYEDAKEMFRKIFKFEMWGAQKTWTKRLILSKSFSITASTGVGKTTFGIFSAIYLSKKGNKVYLVFPTTTLAKLVYEKFVLLGFDSDVIFYHGTKKQKEIVKERLKNGDFKIFISTAQFLTKNFDFVKHLKFDLIFVDDVDALMKSSKNIDKILLLLGFEKFHIDTAKQILKYGKAGDMEKVEELRNILRSNQPQHGILIIASATGSSKKKNLVYRELLGFEIGSSKEVLRNVKDVLVEKDLGKLLNLIKKFGKGGLLFVPVKEGTEKAKEMEEILKSNGVKAKLYEGKDEEIELFKKGEIEILIGVANYYGKLVRGIDLPAHIRYVVFWGIPRFDFYLTVEELRIRDLLSVLDMLIEVLEKPEKEQIELIYFKLRKYIQKLDASQIKIIEEENPEGFLAKIKKEFENARKIVKKYLEREDVEKKLKEYEFADFEKSGEKIIVRIPDVKTYIQASGRCSRMFAGGITFGASLVFCDNHKLINGLERAMRWRYDGFVFNRLEDVNIDELIEKIDKDRETVKKILEGRIKELESKDILKTAVMIVESPNKARTIANFFSKPSKRKIGNILSYETNTGDYILTVVASLGHVFDLVTKEGIEGVGEKNGEFYPIYDSIKRCENGEQFVDQLDCENYDDKLKILESILELVLEHDEVFIATDPDIEGEKIASDIFLFLRPYTHSIYRTEFHEVTPHAIRKAIHEKREIDENLVKAQIVRRIEDRWIGFGLSQKLWEVFKNNKLSAGRVQTPVLGWTIEREEKYRKGLSVYSLIRFENGLTLNVKGKVEKTTIKVEEIEFDEKEISPLPPYTTDTLLEDASRYLKLSAKETMQIAQELFELSLITYHRTDSTRVSNAGIEIAKNWIKESFGEEYFHGRPYGKGGAHECIRPTKPVDADRLIKLIKEGILATVKPLTKNHIRLYDLIFRRFVASQMRSLKVVEEKIKTELGEIEGICEIKEDGWNKVWYLKLIPKIEGEFLKVKDIKYYRSSDTKMFTEGELVKEMKTKGIGRPSTYAKIVSVLLERRYVINKKGFLIPTTLGKKVFNYLSSNFFNLVSEERTRVLEEQLDKIEKGEENYQKILKEVYEELLSYGLVHSV